MKEFIEKLIGRLEEENEWAKTHGKDDKFRKGRISGLNTAKRIVNQLAEEYNNGWIPVSEKFPKIGTLVLATTESGNVCDDVLIYDYENSKSKEPCFHRWNDDMWECYTPRVIAWQPLPQAYQPKGE